MRLYSAYGPYEEPARFVPALAVNALRGRLPPLVDPKVARDFVYIDEVCDAFVRAAGAPDVEPGAVYNVATGTQTTIADAVAAARAIFEITERPVWGSMPDRAWDTSVWVGDPRKIVSELGWSAAIDFPEGLRRVAEWLSTTPLRPRYFG